MFMNEKIRKKLKLPEEKVPYTLYDYANVSCATIPITISSKLKDRMDRKRNIIACGFGAEILNFELGTDGGGAKNLMVKGGGMRYRNHETETTIDNYGNETTTDNLKMNGPEIFNFTSKNIPDLVTKTLESNDAGLNDVSHYIFHQANAYMLNHLRKKIKIAPEKFPLRMDFCGNTVSSTIQIVIAEMMKEKKIQKNELALLAGFGVGYSWGATLLKF